MIPATDPGRQGAKLRAVAATVVNGVVAGGHSLDTKLEQHETSVADADRALLRMLCFGTVRHYYRIDAWIGSLLARPLRRKDRVIHALLAVGIYQLIDTRIPPHAAVAATVDAARSLKRPALAGLVNAVLRRFSRESVEDAEPRSDEARFNHPAWLIATLRRDWPDDWQDILAANDERASMWLRINERRGSRQEYLDQLTAAGIEYQLQDGLEQAVRLAEPRPVDTLPGFAEGRVSVQDGAAQLAAPWLLAGLTTGAGLRVLDACAAPGGKSAHLLELAGDAIDLTCIDIDAARASAIDDNLARLGLAATVTVGDASNAGDLPGFDGILLDAPCSASGVIRRHPDIKLLRRGSDVDELARKQRALLDALWSRVEPGGRLLYVTCSVIARENDAVVSAFLAQTGDAEETEVLHNNNIRDLMRRKACGYQVLPGTAGMDGFYFACLSKKS